MRHSKMTSTAWNDFEKGITTEFIPEDHTRRARDRLRKCRQSSSLSKYLNEFRNITISVGDILEGEKFDRFVYGLKPNVRIEVMKSTVNSFHEATKSFLRVDSALWNNQQKSRFDFSQNSQQGVVSREQHPVPIEIGNVQKSRRPLTDAQKRQR